MGNPAKTALLLILLIFIIVTFFALTGIDVREPEKAANSLAEKVVRLNRRINQALRNFFWSIRVWFQELFAR